MSSFNKVILMGNLTRDCETRFAGNGTAIVKLGLAVNRRWQDADGNWKDQPTFIDITMFGKRGEAFARFHTKGKPAFIEGHMRMDTWDDKQTGQKRSKLYVVADSWEFVGGARDSGGGGGGGGGYGGGGQESTGYEGGSQPVESPAAVDETPF
jgi:single-strand DNA-binding protein